MIFDLIATKMLGWLVALTGAMNVPDDLSVWQIARSWDLHSAHPELEMVAKISDLQCSPQEYLQLPTLLYGAIAVSHSGAQFLRFGDPSFLKANYIFNSPTIECAQLPTTGDLKLIFTAYSPLYAVVSSWPTVTSHRTLADFFYKFSYVGGAFSLILVSISLFFSTLSHENKRIALFLCSSAALIAIYQMGAVLPIFDIDVPMLTVHRNSDRALSLGFLLFLLALDQEKFISRKWLVIHVVMVSVGLVFNIFSRTGDGIQFGSILQFPTALSCLFSMVGFGVKRTFEIKSMKALTVSAVFAAALLSEMAVFAANGNLYSFLPFGVAIGFLIFGIILNEKIVMTYRERDYLRKNLEMEVDRKTQELRDKTAQLENAMHELKSTQAELVESARLASLGTLSAGIAHEINNSINFISGSLQPLERRVMPHIPDSEKTMICKLLKAIKDGTELTIQIVNSLRNYTGLNHANAKDVNLFEVITSVTTMLKSRLRSVTVNTMIDKNIVIFGNIAGLSQIFMNLLSNAADALINNPKGTISITSKLKDDMAIVEVVDNGPGIPQNIVDRIFDPFFTTKEVGKGTGLGLHIVRKEVERHHGTITVTSTENVGTKFVLQLPLNHGRQRIEGAAA